MTAQILVDILNHAYFSPLQLNLVIFDECHAAVKDSPMAQVLSQLQTYEGTNIGLSLGTVVMSNFPLNKHVLIRF